MLQDCAPLTKLVWQPVQVFGAATRRAISRWVQFGGELIQRGPPKLVQVSLIFLVSSRAASQIPERGKIGPAVWQREQSSLTLGPSSNCVK